MTKNEAINQLKSGDHLLYSHNNPFSLAIKIKTWHPISHIAIYVGGDQSFEATLKGVGFYDFNSNGLVGIYRPIGKYDINKGMLWAVNDACGQKYDWKGILGFVNPAINGSKDKMFCSELATRFDRHCGFEPFQSKEDADKIAPFQFATSPCFEIVWENWR